MNPLDILAISFKNLWRRKLRAFLTVLGMIVGTASIVVLVSIGIGINEANRENLERAGSLTTITVNNYRYIETPGGDTGGMRGGTYEEVKLDEKTAAAIKKIPHIEAVMPMVNANCAVKSGQYMTWLNVMAVDIEAAEHFGFKLSEGRLPKPHRGSAYEVVFNPWMLQQFYNPITGKQAINRDGTNKIKLTDRFQMTFDDSNFYNYGGDYVRTDDKGNPLPKGKVYKLSAVGQMAEEGNNYAWYCLMDIEAIRKLYKENKAYIYGADLSTYQQIQVKVDEFSNVMAVQKEIENMGLGAESLQDQLKMAEESTAQIRMALGAIGGVSLFIAAIGIMNTMMMSIYERTKEIGIIKVLGCKMGNIASQFLTEAAYIGLFGGALGLGVSYGISALLNKFMLMQTGMKSVIPLYLSIGAVLFSIAVALVSGMYPAIRAMRLSALTAIRNE